MFQRLNERDLAHFEPRMLQRLNEDGYVFMWDYDTREMKVLFGEDSVFYQQANQQGLPLWDLLKACWRHEDARRQFDTTLTALLNPTSCPAVPAKVEVPTTAPKPTKTTRSKPARKTALDTILESGDYDRLRRYIHRGMHRNLQALLRQEDGRARKTRRAKKRS